MEEVVQELREQGVLSDVGATGRSSLPTDLHLPTTVQGVLAARIDRLTAEEKDLLHQLAVIGRQFPLSLLRQVITQPEDELYRLLASLQRKEFLYEQPAFPEPDYLFKHALTQEVAYGTVLQDKRKALHERTAQAIESLCSTKLEDHYSQLAYHYSRSGNTPKAVVYLHLAGQQAVQHSANAEAITHLTTALELLKTLPDTPERIQQELTLQIALGVPLTSTKGFAAPKWKESTPVPGSSVGRSARPRSSSLCCGDCGCLCSAGAAAVGAGVGRAIPPSGPERPRPSPPSRGPLHVGGRPVMARRVVSCPHPFGAGPHSLRPSTAPLPCYSLWD